MADKSADKGLIVLGFMDNGIRHTSNNKRPIGKPDDLKGLKIRTPPSPVAVSIFRALGADTQALKFSELYIALQQGAVDGQENPLEPGERRLHPARDRGGQRVDPDRAEGEDP